jgi:phosphopantothenoylcysteine decarboxylase/phosphopantothenate--cysteine ligase
MGYALAFEAKRRGAEVTLVSGPVTEVPPSGVRLVRVTSAEEMATAVDAYRDDADVVIATAAVADFTPIDVKSSKMKRREMDSGEMMIHLKPTRDILRSIGEHRRREQIIVGFALESENLLISARRKLEEKRCDMIVANSAVELGSGFGGDSNTIVLVEQDAEQEFPRMSKRECAVVILDAIERIRSRRNDNTADIPTSTDRV